MAELRVMKREKLNKRVLPYTIAIDTHTTTNWNYFMISFNGTRYCDDYFVMLFFKLMLRVVIMRHTTTN
jgi:hypothetical protein